MQVRPCAPWRRSIAEVIWCSWVMDGPAERSPKTSCTLSEGSGHVFAPVMLGPKKVIIPTLLWWAWSTGDRYTFLLGALKSAFSFDAKVLTYLDCASWMLPTDELASTTSR